MASIEPADVVVGVLEEAGVDLHLALEHRLELVGHVVPRRDLVVAGGQLGVGGDDAELLLAGEGRARAARPSRRRTRPGTCRPTPRARGAARGSPRREVDEERLVGHERLLLADPADRAVGEVLGEVVALLGRRGRLDRGRALVQRRVPLVVLAADEAVERLEPAAARRPRVERAHRRGLPHRHLVALAELRRRVAVELQRHRQRRLRVRPQRAVARAPRSRSR